jgi:hypothetical protein
MSAQPFDYSELQSRLGELANLPAGWDDEGAARIAPLALQRALAICAALASSAIGAHLAHPVASPCADGSVDLHWKLPGLRALVNIGAGGEVGVYVNGEIGAALVGELLPP